MELFTFLFCVFLISPLFGIVCAIILMSKYYRHNGKSTILLFFISIFLGCINAHKLAINSDLISYLEMYKKVGEYDYFSYLQIEGKEYFFYTINYCSYYLLGGNPDLYVVIITSIGYFFLFCAIFLLSKFLKIEFEDYALALIVAALFPNLFSMSAHLIRQFIAGGLICFFLVKSITTKKKYFIIYYLLAGLIHSSSLFFGIVFLPTLRRGYNIKNLLFVIFSVICFSFLINSYGNLLNGIPILGYAVSRFLGRESAIWETEKMGALSFFLQILVIFLLYFGAIVRFKAYEKLSTLFYVSVILVFFIGANYNNTEISSRYNFYVYFLVPFGFLFLYKILKVKNNSKKRIINFFFTLVFISWFCYKIQNGVFVYTNLQNLIFNYL